MIFLDEGQDSHLTTMHLEQGLLQDLLQDIRRNGSAIVVGLIPAQA